MKEFENNNAVFVPEGDVRVVETCDGDPARAIGLFGRLYCAANTCAREVGTVESAGARYRASLWLGIAADLRRARRN